jgi:hypothetical protein
MGDMATGISDAQLSAMSGTLQRMIAACDRVTFHLHPPLSSPIEDHLASRAAAQRGEYAEPVEQKAVERGQASVTVTPELDGPTPAYAVLWTGERDIWVCGELVLRPGDTATWDIPRDVTVTQD